MGGSNLVPAKNVVILGLTVTKRRRLDEQNREEEDMDSAVEDLTGDLTWGGDHLTGDLTGGAQRRSLTSSVAVTASYSVTSTALSSTAVSSLINAGQ